MSLILSVGRWGGIYYHFGWTWRICLGWIALTVVPRDFDVWIANLLTLVDGEG